MVVPFPVWEDAVNDLACAYYGHFLMVNAQIPKEEQEMAWKFIHYMLSHAQEYLDKVNILVPTKDLLESDYFKGLPYMDVFMSDLARAKPVFLHENGYQFEQYIKMAVESVMLTDTTPEEALETLREQIQEVLDENM